MFDLISVADLKKECLLLLDKVLFVFFSCVVFLLLYLSTSLLSLLSFFACSASLFFFSDFIFVPFFLWFSSFICFSVFSAFCFPYFFLFFVLGFSLSLSLSLLFCCSCFFFCFSAFPRFVLQLLCFLSLLSICLFSVCFILSCLYAKWNPRETLNETQTHPKAILFHKKP